MFTAEQQASVELAGELTPEQWELSSLCEGWTVRDVIAHMARHIPILDACELVVHQQDVRCPTGLPRQYPEVTLRVCLDFSTTVLGNFGVAERAKRLGRGLRLVATDLAWSKGDGPEVAGTGAALLMTIAGRGAVLGDLAGPGVAVLAERLGDRELIRSTGR